MELLTKQELIKVLKIHQNTFYKYLKLGMPIKIKHPKRFVLSDVIEWLNQTK